VGFCDGEVANRQKYMTFIECGQAGTIDGGRGLLKDACSESTRSTAAAADADADADADAATSTPVPCF
jgi:hypothetical protein